MATFLSGAAWGTWSGVRRNAYLTGDVTRSGNNVKLSNLRLYFTLAGSGYAGKIPEVVKIQSGGATNSTTTAVWDFNGSTSNTVSLNDANVTVSVADTSRTFALQGEEAGDRAEFTVNFPSGVVAPTKPTISVVQGDRSSNIITYGTTSFGNPSSGTVYVYGGTSSTPTTQVTAKTAIGQSSFTHTGLESNVTYYYRARAFNGQAWSDYSDTVSVTTKPAVYVSYQNLSKATQKLYASMGGQAKQVLKLYDSNNGVARRIY